MDRRMSKPMEQLSDFRHLYLYLLQLKEKMMSLEQEKIIDSYGVHLGYV